MIRLRAGQNPSDFQFKNPSRIFFTMDSAISLRLEHHTHVPRYNPSDSDTGTLVIAYGNHVRVAILVIIVRVIRPAMCKKSTDGHCLLQTSDRANTCFRNQTCREKRAMWLVSGLDFSSCFLTYVYVTLILLIKY
jgi:hypothetical protein